MRNLGKRMKQYEYTERRFLTHRIPTIIRLDIRDFHILTKGLNKPFDSIIVEAMWETARYLCENIKGCQIAYTQSDKITLMLTDYGNEETKAWFDKNIQKMTSISASMATLAFNRFYRELVQLKITLPVSIDFMSDEKQSMYRKKYNKYHNKINTALFESRVFNIPKEEVCNYFIWIQNELSTKSIQMVGRSQLSNKQLHGKSCNEIQEKLFAEKAWDDLPTYQKRGVCIIKERYDKEGKTRNRWIIDKNINIFTQDRDYIDQYV